jgi:hypothetical protein
MKNDTTKLAKAIAEERSANIHEKLVVIRDELQGKISKDGINTFFGNSHYATKEGMLRIINPALGRHGLGMRINCLPLDNPTLCRWTLCIYDGEGLVETGIVAPIIHDPQKVGAAMTYFTRYLLEMALGICAQEDDDGNAAQASYTEQDRQRAYDRSAYAPAGDDDVNQTQQPLLKLPLDLDDEWAYEPIRTGPLEGHTWRDVADADVGIPPVELREILVEGLKGARAGRDSETADKIAAVGLALRKHLEGTK